MLGLHFMKQKRNKLCNSSDEGRSLKKNRVPRRSFDERQRLFQKKKKTKARDVAKKIKIKTIFIIIPFSKFSESLFNNIY